MHPKRVLFEPWSLGDSLIAASVLLTDSSETSLACASRWHELIRGGLGAEIRSRLLPIDLAYTSRDRTSPLHWTSNHGESLDADYRGEVLSIRGDPRDLIAARRIFPKAQIRMNGWLSFAARKSSILDLPWRLGFLPVRNRYLAWSLLCGIPFAALQNAYRERRQRVLPSGRVVIHLGAQWKSKQYPYVRELYDSLAKTGRELRIIASSHDPLPQGIDERRVNRRTGQELLNEFEKAEYVLANDSGPMHLAAMMGRKVIVLARASNILEWIPPGVTSLASSRMPKGYKPSPNYLSDKPLLDWVTPDEIMKELTMHPPSGSTTP